MDPWATPSPWADDSNVEAAAASTSKEDAEPVALSSPIQAAKVASLDTHDPWATDGAVSAPPSPVQPKTERTATLPVVASAVRLSEEAAEAPSTAALPEPAPWVDEGPTAWGGESMPITLPGGPAIVSEAGVEAEGEGEAQRPASPWGGTDELPPPQPSAALETSSSGWDPESRDEEVAKEVAANAPISTGAGDWGGESADPWAPPGQARPAWPGASAAAGREESDEEEVEIPIRDLDAEAEAKEQAGANKEDAKPAAAAVGSRITAAFSSWRRPMSTSSIETAPSAAPVAEKVTTAEAPASKPNPGWAHVPRKNEGGGLAAKFSGLWSGGGSGPTPTSSIIGVPPVVSAADEEEEEQEAKQTAPVDLFGDEVAGASKGASTASQAPAGLTKWLRWGRKAGAPPPEGMSADDLAWLESLPSAAPSDAAGASGGADDLEQWLAGNGASQTVNAPPAPAWARGMQQQQQRHGASSEGRYRIDSTPRGGTRLQLAPENSRHSNGQPPRLAPAPAAPPRSAVPAASLLDFDDFESAPAPSSTSNPLAPRMPSQASASNGRVFSNASRATASSTGESNDAFGDFESWNALGGGAVSAPPQPPQRSSSKATIGSGLGKGRYAQRNPNLAGGRRPTKLDVDYNTDEDDEDIYGKVSPVGNPAGSDMPYSDRGACGGDTGRTTDEGDDSWSWGVYSDNPARLSPPPKGPGLASYNVSSALPPRLAVAGTTTASNCSSPDAVARVASPPIRSISPKMVTSNAAVRTSTPPVLPPPPPSNRRAPLLAPPPGSTARAAPLVAPPAAASVPQVSVSPPQQQATLSDGKGLTQADISFFDSL